MADINISSIISKKCENEPLVVQHLCEIHGGMVAGYFSLSSENRAQTGKIVAKFDLRDQLFTIAAEVFSRSNGGEYITAEARVYVDDFRSGIAQRVSFALRDEIKKKIEKFNKKQVVPEALAA